MVAKASFVPTRTAAIPPNPPAMKDLIEFAVEDEVDAGGGASTAVSVPW